MSDYDDAFNYMTSPDRPWNQRTVSDELNRIRHTQLIVDPFPDHSDFAMLRKINPYTPEPEPISIWAAHQAGYDKAYKEIEIAIGNKKIEFDIVPIA